MNCGQALPLQAPGPALPQMRSDLFACRIAQGLKACRAVSGAAHCLYNDHIA